MLDPVAKLESMQRGKSPRPWHRYTQAFPPTRLQSCSSRTVAFWVVRLERYPLVSQLLKAAYLAGSSEAGHQVVTRQRREGSRPVAMFCPNWTVRRDSGDIISATRSFPLLRLRVVA